MTKKSKATHYVRRLVVAGFGEFPIDMLRYDNAVPETERDSALISNRAKQRRVALRRFVVGVRTPTAERWKSFGWTVVEDDAT